MHARPHPSSRARTETSGRWARTSVRLTCSRGRCAGLATAGGSLQARRHSRNPGGDRPGHCDVDVATYQDHLRAKALALAPARPDTLHIYANLLAAVGRLEQSLATILWLNGQDDAAIALLEASPLGMSVGIALCGFMLRPAVTTPRPVYSRRARKGYCFRERWRQRSAYGVQDRTQPAPSRRSTSTSS